MPEIDAGLAELTEDVLGPDPSTPDATEAPDAAGQAETPAEPTEPQPVGASAPVAPTAIPTGPDTFVVNGKTYTTADILALNTTAEQFKHLQKRWTNEAVPLLERQATERQQPGQPAQPALTPQQLQSEIRRSFDPVVRSAVQQGFVEADLAELYPDAVAGYMLLRDSHTHLASRYTALEQKVAQYEEMIGQEHAQTFAQQTKSGIENNMVALSTQGGVFQSLADPAIRGAFFDYLVKWNPLPDQYNDPEYIADAFAAFKRKELLAAQGASVQTQVAAAQAEKRKLDLGKRAAGDALPAARPTAGPAIVPSVLQEMVDDHLGRQNG